MWEQSINQSVNVIDSPVMLSVCDPLEEAKNGGSKWEYRSKINWLIPALPKVRVLCFWGNRCTALENILLAQAKQGSLTAPPITAGRDITSSSNCLWYLQFVLRRFWASPSKYQVVCKITTSSWLYGEGGEHRVRAVLWLENLRGKSRGVEGFDLFWRRFEYLRLLLASRIPRCIWL